MTTELAPSRVRLRTPADLIDAVPYLVGFTPQNSLVMLALHGERKRLGIVSRVDLPEPKHAAVLAAGAVDYLLRDGADRAVAVFYPPSDGPEHPSVRPIADALDTALAAVGIEVIEVLCVGADRWWSLRCDGPDCCPSSGRHLAHEGTSIIAATAALRGVALYRTREELVRSIDPVDGPVARAMADALPLARAARQARVVGGDRLGVCAEFFQLLTQLVEARVEGRGSALAVDEAAQIIVGLDDLPVRDAMLSWHGGDWGDATRALFAELVTLAVPPYDIAPLTVLGWLAYLNGDGAQANVIVDRALGPEPRDRDDPDDRPGYNLIRILDDALSRAIDPKIFREPLAAAGNWGDATIPAIPRRPAYRRRQGSARSQRTARSQGTANSASPAGEPRSTRSKQRRRR
jgi:hypothetical protein